MKGAHVEFHQFYVSLHVRFKTWVKYMHFVKFSIISGVVNIYRN